MEGLKLIRNGMVDDSHAMVIAFDEVEQKDGEGQVIRRNNLV